MIAYNFTERVRRVLAMARDAAVRLNHEYVGTEHILLGLIREGEGVGASVLHNLNAPSQKIRREIEAILQMGHLASMPLRDLPYTSRAKKVLELAFAESVKLNHNHVGTEHVLLGLILEEQGIAAQVLAACGVTYAAASDEVLRLLGLANPGSETPGVTGTVELKLPGRSVEIRSYTLKPGTRSEFHRAMSREVVPMQKRRGMDVISCAPSSHDENSYYLIRAYESLEHRAESQDAFYGSDEWRNGPRECLLSAIESCAAIVIEMEEETLNSLRTL